MCFFFKQKAAYDMRISDWSSDVCSSDLLSRDARGRWEHSMDALRQTMLVQAQVVQNVNADTGELARLVTASEAAIGSLQAQQATNQLVPPSTTQHLQPQELVAAQYRAEALASARTTARQETARAPQIERTPQAERVALSG